MNAKKRFFKFLNILSKIIMILAFIITATAVILSAAGYKLEFKSKHIYQTSMLVVDSIPKDSILVVDSEDQNGSSPWQISNLIPGYHTISVGKDGYQTWSNRFNTSPGETKLYEDVILHLQEPIVTQLDKSDNQKLFNRLAQQGVDINIISKNNNEIYFNGELVTRLSNEFSNAKVYPDGKHISFIEDNQLHIIDLDGSNDKIVISKLPSTQYAFLDNGTSVIYIDGDNLMSAKIR